MSRRVINKISRQIFLITPILLIFFSSGCSKSLLDPDRFKSHFGFIKEETVGEWDPSTDSDEKPGLEQNIATAKQGIKGKGTKDSIRTEPLGDDSGKKSVKKGNGMLSEGGDKDKIKDTPEPLIPDNENGKSEKFPDFAELFVPDKKGKPCVGDCSDVPLPRDEESRRLPYRSTDRLRDIHFGFDKYSLDDRLRAILEENVAYLKTHPVSKIEIQGHCDERGSNNYNMALGERRAHSIKSYLIFRGIDEKRIYTVSYGEEKPFCSESNEKCWFQNRRGRFLVAE